MRHYVSRFIGFSLVVFLYFLTGCVTLKPYETETNVVKSSKKIQKDDVIDSKSIRKDNEINSKGIRRDNEIDSKVIRKDNGKIFQSHINFLDEV